MGLTSSLHLGNSALTAAQLAIQVAGNNLANAATPGYSRQTASLVPLRNDISGRISVGTGVRITDVRRQVDDALQARLWSGMSYEAAASQEFGVLAQIESLLGELGENDLSSELSAFFNSWSERANLNQSSAVVVQQGQRLADFVQRLRSGLVDQRQQMDRQLGIQTSRANGLLSQVAELNRTISDAEASGGRANALRDQRDQVLSELAQYMDVTAIEQNNGAVDVLVGSTPIVLGGTSRGIELRRTSQGNTTAVTVNVIEDGQRLSIRSGHIGAGLAGRDGAITNTISKLDTFASQLIYQVNRIHSLGTNAAGHTSLTGSLSVAAGDRGMSLNNPANGTFAGLPFRATSGAIEIQVTSPSGALQTVRIDIDLDGRDATGALGFDGDTSLDDIRAALDGVSGISATIGADGRLRIDAQAGYSYSFTDDTSGVLAVLGVNSYFTGSTAADIAVNAALMSNPSLLSVGKIVDGVFIENAAALEMAGLQDLSLDALGGVSLSGSWIETVQELGVKTDAARTRADASMVVRQSLEAQRAAVSGVSIDEESINLLTFQRQYQGAARFISVVDELTQTLIALV
jgi:flagellar hook-associated protein 1